MWAWESEGYIKMFDRREMLWLSSFSKNMESFDGALVMCSDGRRGHGVQLFLVWQRPWGLLLAGVFHNARRKGVTMKIVLLIPLCLISSATSRSILGSILPLLIKTAVVALHCHLLFGGRKKKIMLVGMVLNLLFAFYLSCIFCVCATKRQKLFRVKFLVIIQT